MNRQQTMDTFDKAILLINTICVEIELGTKFYDKSGKLLDTPLEIVKTMQDENGVIMKPIQSRQKIFAKLADKSKEELQQ